MATGLEMIAEWRKGCSVAPTKPEDCPNCTLALVNAVEAGMREKDAEIAQLRAFLKAISERSDEQRHIEALAEIEKLRETLEKTADCLAWYIERYRCKCGHHWCTRCKADREATKLLERG